MVEAIRKHNSIIGEGAIWDYKYKRLLWVDIKGCFLYLYYPDTDKEVRYELKGNPGTVVPYKLDEVGLSLDTSFCTFNLITQEYTYLYKLKDVNDSIRFNDGKCGPDGRFYCGTMDRMAKKSGNYLYRLNNDNTVSKLIDNIGISNGLVWTKDKKIFYYIDTFADQVWGYDFDLDTGDISNKRVCVEKGNEEGIFDGMAIDENDNLWIAHYEGSKVTCFNPINGLKIDEIKIPAYKITSVAFGGEKMEDLYITSACDGLENYDSNQGGLFRVKLDVRGQRADYFRQKRTY